MIRTTFIFALSSIVSIVAVILGPILPKQPVPTDPPEPAPVVVAPAPPPAPTPVPVPVGPTWPSRFSVGDGIRLDGALSGTHILRGPNGESWLVADIYADEAEGVRPALNLALVIDRSGSMAGPKLSAAKEAAKAVVSRLSPRDRVSIIAYGSSVTEHAVDVRANKAGRAELTAVIDGIEDFGGTYISGALESAHRILARRGHQGVSRIILLSDGEANEGITEVRGFRRLSQRIAKAGISISTVGVGSEFNEDALLTIADQSGGNYQYLRGHAGLRGAMLAEVLSTVKTRARELYLTVDPMDGTTVSSVFGYEPIRRDGTWTVRLPDLPAGGHHRVVFRLDTNIDALGPLGTARVHLSWVTPEDNTPKSTSGTLGVTVTDSVDAVSDGTDPDVVAASLRALAARSAEEASRRYAKGDVAGAQQMMRRRLSAIILENQNRLGDEGLDREVKGLRGMADFDGAGAPSSASGRDLVKSLKQRALEMSR